MIKTRLIRIVPESKKFIAATVLLQWIGLCANVILVWTIARLLDNLRLGLTENMPLTCLILGGVLVIRVLCVKLAALASYHASRSVKRTLRGMIYEKLLVLGPTYSERIHAPYEISGRKSAAFAVQT